MHSNLHCSDVCNFALLPLLFRRRGELEPVDSLLSASMKRRSSARMQDESTQASESSRLLPKKKDDATGLLRHEDLEEWRRDNHYILTGYRRTLNSYWLCFKSIFSVHNETVNIVRSSAEKQSPNRSLTSLLCSGRTSSALLSRLQYSSISSRHSRGIRSDSLADGAGQQLGPPSRTPSRPLHDRASPGLILLDSYYSSLAPLPV